MLHRIERTISAAFQIKSRKESSFSESAEGPRLTKASYVLVYEGDLEGEGILEELKVHFTSKRAAMYGLQRVTARLGEVQGSFILHYNGKFRNGVVTSKQIVVPGSGTGGLKGLRGEMNLVSASAEIFAITFKYRFA